MLKLARTDIEHAHKKTLRATQQLACIENCAFKHLDSLTIQHLLEKLNTEITLTLSRGHKS